MIKVFVIGILVGAASYLGMGVMTTGILLHKAQRQYLAAIILQNGTSSQHSSSDEAWLDDELSSKTIVPVHPSTPEELQLRHRHPHNDLSSQEQDASRRLYQNPTRGAALYHWHQFLSVWQTTNRSVPKRPSSSSFVPPSNDSPWWRLQSWMPQQRRRQWSSVHSSPKEEETTDDPKPTNASSSSQSDHYRSMDPLLELALQHLELASEGGHPEAQYLVANALASGILPLPFSTSSSFSILSQQQQQQRSSFQGLVVPSDLTASNQEESVQLTRALMLWHLAAMEGHVESAIALGYRHLYSATGGDVVTFLSDTASSSGILMDKELHPSPTTLQKKQTTAADHKSKLHNYGVLGTCETAMAYYEAAAHGVMDDLETSVQWRGKIAPSMDRHVLVEMHMHGGISALSKQNKPDELEEAIQYYHMRATDVHDPDVSAAYALAEFYHYGWRGVTQNVTLALQYYEMAAQQKSWAAAGHAGTFHLWGLGMPDSLRNMSKANHYFSMGTPGGLDRCVRRFREGKKATKPSHNDDDDEDEDDDEPETSNCDPNCVNGMGLLHLYGVPDLVPVNIDLAKQFFFLAKDMGNVDAAYNLAMMRLGWLTYEYTKNNNNNSNHHKESSPSIKEEGSNDTEMDDSVDEENDTKETEEAQVDKHKRFKTQSEVKVDSAKVDLDATADTAPDVSSGTVEDKDDTGIQFSRRTSKVGKMRTYETQGLRKLGKFYPKTGEPAAAASQKDNDGANNQGPTKAEYQIAVSELIFAANKGHLQARHRLAAMYARGIYANYTKSSTGEIVSSQVVTQSCAKALKLYMSVAESGRHISNRLMAGYKEYNSNRPETSLRNYLEAAEAGVLQAQVNAAFLLEQGYCLGLGQRDCWRASMRLWRAAARQGHMEACLRVGDFYYYGRMREGHPHPTTHLPTTKDDLVIGPFSWLKYFVYPEGLITDIFPGMKQDLIHGLLSMTSHVKKMSSTTGSNETVPLTKLETSTTTCNAGEGKEGTCEVSGDETDDSPRHKDAEEEGEDDHFTSAAQYYRMAAEAHNSARANFNLGFMHEWGLGLTQDFPLAKRHYDLAATSSPLESHFIVKLSLFCMHVHERIVRWNQTWGQEFNTWLDSVVLANYHVQTNVPSPSSLTTTTTNRNHDDTEYDTESSNAPSASEYESPSSSPNEAKAGTDDTTGHAVPPSSSSRQRTKKTRMNIIISHLLSWESAAILILTKILIRLLRYHLLTRLGAAGRQRQI